MIGQSSISSKPISNIVDPEIKTVFFFVNSCRTVNVREETREVIVQEESRTIDITC